MWQRLGISEADWERTPQSVRTALLSLQQQVYLLEIRAQAYDQQITALQTQVAQVEQLKVEVAELRERLGQNSQNSSKPPSSDPPSLRPGGSRQSKGRKRGGQPGHPGHGRKLKASCEVDQVIELRPWSCTDCGHLLLGEDPQPVRRQVSDVPPARVVVTEYRQHTLHCTVCGRANQAAWPVGLPAGSFGSRAQAIISYLTGRLGISHRDVTEVMSVLHGLELSLGSVAAIQGQVSAALEQPVETAQGFVQQQPVSYVDETS
jgi:transposase